MPERVNIANVTCPASVLPTAPLEVVLVTFLPGIPRRLTIVIPAGHSGLTGLAAGFAHQPVIPDDNGQFFSGDDDVIHLDLTNYPAGPQWSVFLCNSDLQPHAWQVRMEFDEITGAPVDTAVIPIAGDDISAAGDAALAVP